MLENPYIHYTLAENLWVSLGVMKPINWSYGPFVIVEANFVWQFLHGKTSSVYCVFFS